MGIDVGIDMDVDSHMIWLLTRSSHNSGYLLNFPTLQEALPAKSVQFFASGHQKRRVKRLLLLRASEERSQKCDC